MWRPRHQCCSLCRRHEVYWSIERMEDGACLKRDFDHINQWCDLWQMELNQLKRGLLSITTNARSFHFPYPVSDVQVKTMETH